MGFLSSTNLTYSELQHKIIWDLISKPDGLFSNKDFNKDILAEQVLSNYFDKGQLELIYKGLLHGLDISLYASAENGLLLMYEIFQWLTNNLNIQNYLLQSFTPEQLFLIRKGLLKGLDVTIYSRPTLQVDDMQLLLDCLEDGVDTSKFDSDVLSYQQRWFISECVRDNTYDIMLPYIEQDLAIKQLCEIKYKLT